MIAEIRSGGQTGVDVGALRAGKALGVRTGGVMPRGFRTLAGPRPEWAAEFGLVEHTSSAYPPRTLENVRDSDITVRIAVDFESAGERCTAKAIERYNCLWYDIRVIDRGSSLLALRDGRGRLVASEERIAGACDVIRLERKRLGRDLIVNFAGNSEKTAPGIECAAERIVAHLLERCLKG